MKRNIVAIPLLIALLLVALAAATSAQVATLRTPDPESEATPAPAEEVDGEEAILQFVGCLRENGIDIPDPQFGAEGTRFGVDPETLASVDLLSSDFLDAFEACQYLLEALQPELDQAQVAEQNEQLLEFAECMRAEGIDFPDPDPLRGFTMGTMRGDDGSLMFDPFSPAFQAASAVCAGELDLTPPGAG